MLELNKIYQGDSIELIKDIPDSFIDFVITDPPFKISQTYSANVDADNLMAVCSIFPISQELFRVCKSGTYLAMYYDTRILPLAFEAMRYAGWKYLRGLTFYRRWGNAHKLYGWMSTSDFILIFRKPSDTPYKFYSQDWRHDVYLKDKPEKEGFNHVAQKPIEDFKHIIKHLCPEEGTVLDPFMGSGTTALACKQTNRKFLGFEINKEYCDIIKKRLEQTTILVRKE